MDRGGAGAEVAVQEHGILFSAPMVRALVARRKSQTRRCVSPQPRADHAELFAWFGSKAPEGGKGGPCGLWARNDGTARYVQSCPYGAPGDRLWVREAWRGPLDLDDSKPRDIEPGSNIRYEADGIARTYRDAFEFYDRKADVGHAFGKLRPGIFLPRWASRLTLHVLDVRVERLQEISPLDAVQEGIFRDVPGSMDGVHPHAVATYETLWGSINGKRMGCSWADNPWVWVLTFRVMR